MKALREGELVVILWTGREDFMGMRENEPCVLGLLRRRHKHYPEDWKVWNILTGEYYPHWVHESRLRVMTPADVDAVEQLVALRRATAHPDDWPVTTEDGIRKDAHLWLRLIRAVLQDGGMFPEEEEERR